MAYNICSIFPSKLLDGVDIPAPGAVRDDPAVLHAWDVQP